ncbi:MAG: helix-turn-helix domain-containing protein [Nitrospinae bacterium]|nr:helix-turn-helix domain-containing protein [Nitrospinota bacterium]
MDFENCWHRVKQSTELKKQTQLAEFLEISSSNVSEAKVKDRFPLAWAFKIGQAHNIYTDWILTGKGPMNADEIIQPSKGETSAVGLALQFILENGSTYQRGAVKGYLNELVEEITDQNKKKVKSFIYGLDFQNKQSG